MNLAGNELGRICAFVNRRPWMFEDPSNCSSGTIHGSQDKKQQYFLDRLGTTNNGDSSLHRICAWHTTPEQLISFVHHMAAHSNLCTDVEMNEEGDQSPDSMPSGYRYLGMPPAPHLSDTNHKGATALHVAVYRNAFHAPSIVKQLLQLQPSLASTPMSCGSYPLHVLCGHNITIRKEVLLALLAVDPSVVYQEDIQGDTPLSLLWKNVLRFRWAQLDKIVLDDEDDNVAMDGKPNNRRHRRPSWMTMISPNQYVEYSLLMIQAALGKKTLELVDICSMPRCPPLLIRLVLQYPNRFGCPLGPDWEAKDSCGRTALHLAAHVDPVTPLFVPCHVQRKEHSIIDLLIGAFPTMALAKDRRGRLPLHYLLEKNFPIGYPDDQALYRFVSANPDSLRRKDPVTGLYPFALLAATTTSDDDDSYMQVEEDTSSRLAHIEAVFRLLRQFPEAAIYRG